MKPLRKRIRAGTEEAAAGRGELLAAAARAFMVNGYAGTSIDMVAEELGCTKGRIYYQYKGKADLFFDVQREAMLMNVATVRPHADAAGSPRARLRAMVEDQLVVNMERLPFERVLMQGVEMHLAGSTTPAQRSALAAQIRLRDEFEQLFVKVVEEGVRAGEFRQLEVRLFCKSLLGAMTWMLVWYRPPRDDSADKRRALARELADSMLYGLGPVGG